jgi:hypothetical protein
MYIHSLLQAKLQREREKEMKEMAARREYVRRQEEENKKAAEAEKLIQKLEEEERAMIERLKRTQEMQKKVLVKNYSYIILLLFTN